MKPKLELEELAKEIAAIKAAYPIFVSKVWLKKIWKDIARKYLKLLSDGEIAACIGCTEQNVNKFRQKVNHGLQNKCRSNNYSLREVVVLIELFEHGPTWPARFISDQLNAHEIRLSQRGIATLKKLYLEDPPPKGSFLVQPFLTIGFNVKFFRTSIRIHIPNLSEYGPFKPSPVVRPTN